MWNVFTQTKNPIRWNLGITRFLPQCRVNIPLEVFWGAVLGQRSLYPGACCRCRERLCATWCKPTCFFCSKHQTVSTYGTLQRVHLWEVLSIHPQLDLRWYSWFPNFPSMHDLECLGVGFTMGPNCEWPRKVVNGRCVEFENVYPFGNVGSNWSRTLLWNRSDGYGIKASLGHRNSRKAVEVVEWYHDCSCFSSFPKVIWSATSSLITVFAARVSPYNSMWSRSLYYARGECGAWTSWYKRSQKPHSQKRSLGGSVKGLNFQTLNY